MTVPKSSSTKVFNTAGVLRNVPAVQLAFACHMPDDPVDHYVPRIR
jgi:uncharacterized Zn-finger protein